MCFARAIILCCALLWWVPVQAHDPGLSSVSVALHPERIELVTTLSALDAQSLVSHQTASAGSVADPEFIRNELVRVSGSLWQLVAGGSELVLLSSAVEMVRNDNVVVTQHFLVSPPAKVRFGSTIFERLPPGHRQHATVFEGKDHVVLAKLLSRDEPAFDLPSPLALAKVAGAASSAAPVVSFAGFLRIGIEHILTGYDHLLFLFAVLVTAQGKRAVFKIITSFTIAHSLTLALSAWDIVSLPARLVEPLIAATIVFVALRNWARRERTTERVGLIFAFGLIHGLGFASVLRDHGISLLGTSAWRALAGFNVGVELGQLAVAALVLPLVWYLGSRENHGSAWAQATSGLIAVAGVYWLLERLGSI